MRGPDTARALLPPGRGRGSSVSSIVCYLTGLSHIDPVENELFLGRFLNEELTSLPDIDLDFPRDIREVLIPRMHERYGAERSALVAAFPTFRSRGAIRELGKVLGLPPGELERAARGAEPWAVRGVTGDVEAALGLEPGGPPAAVYDPDPRMAAPFAMSTAEWQAMVNGRDPAKEGGREAVAEARYAALPGRWEWLARLCDEAYGLPRHLSQHSGGMIVSTRPLVDCCPVLPAAMEGRQLCQWDKDSCADAGFLKIDLLGLGMLSAVERCVESIARTRGERVDLSRIPFDDAETYAAIQEADTMGVFQIESRAQMQSLRRTRPETLDDLTIQVAIVRPGPILGGAVNPYIARLQALREDPDFVVPYDHPSLEPVLRDTLGTIIFQDQVIECAMAFAGFSPGRGGGAAAGDEPQALRGGDRGLPPALRRGRGAHARRRRGDRRARVLDDRRLLGLRLPQGPRRRVRAARLPVDLAARALRPGVPVRAAQRAADGLLRLGHAGPRGPAARDPDAGRRRQRERGGVRGGRRRLRADRARLRQRRARRRGRRARGRARGGRALPLAGRPRLARGGGAAVAGEARVGGGVRRAGRRRAAPRRRRRAPGANRARRAALWQLGVAAPGEPVREGTQLALPLDTPAPPELRELAPWESMVADYATTGLTLGAHPMALLRERLPAGAVSCRDLETLRHEASVTIGGLVVARQRPGTAKGIVFLLLEDEFGTINLIVPPDVYERHRLTVRTEPLILARGRLEKLAMAGGAINVFVKRLEPLVTPGEDVAGVVELAERRAAAAAAEAPADRAAEQADPSEILADFRGVAPAVQSFAVRPEEVAGAVARRANK